MKILLLGEYSGVFSELAHGLKNTGHDVSLINDGDNYKSFYSDYPIVYPTKRNGLFGKILHAISYRLGIDGIVSFWKQWHSLKLHLKSYDIVQIINPVVFSGWGALANLIILRFLRRNNNKVFLSVLGFDYYQMVWFERNFNPSGYYSPSLNQFIRPDYAFKYRYCLFYKTLNDYAIKISQKIIPGLLEYKYCYDWTGKTTNIIPFPISKEKIGKPLSLKDTKTIIIFHGWQKGKEKFKGNDVFDRVVNRVAALYGKRVKYLVVQKVPYDEYITLYNNCHIFIDQLYSLDKGMNGLLGMAAGKVVFAGLSTDSLNAYPSYNGEEIGVSTTIDENLLYEKFCKTIDSLDLMEKISKNAIEFVKKNHETSIVVKMYLDAWTH